jgi:hypothetical protein
MERNEAGNSDTARIPDSAARSGVAEPPPTWEQPHEVWRVVSHLPHLRRTIATALIIGTILFCINQLNVVLDGHANGVVWLKGGLTYLVPFVVSNVGILIATRRAR